MGVGGGGGGVRTKNHYKTNDCGTTKVATKLVHAC